MGQKAKAQWALYSDADLQGGAQHYGLTVEQERQRLRIVQSDFRQWPTELLSFLKDRHDGGLELIGFTLIQRSVIVWLKAGNSVSTDPLVEMREMAEALAA